MTFGRLLLILWFQAASLGTAALVAYRLGRRAGWFRGVCHGMHSAGKALWQRVPFPDFEVDYQDSFRRPN